MDSKSDEKIFLAAIAVSLLSILPFDTGFYTFTRIVISICSVVGVLALRKKDSGIWIIFALFAILYNPILPVYLHDKELWMTINATTAVAFLWLFKEVGGDASLIDTVLFWISRLGFLGCLAFPAIVYMIMQSTGERMQMEPFIVATLAFWSGGIIGALAINKVFFGQTSVWVTNKNSSTDSSD